MTNKDRLKELFRQRALQFGDFTLASGKKSSYYVNSKKVLFHAEAISLLGDLLYDATKRSRLPGHRRAGGGRDPDGRGGPDRLPPQWPEP